MSSHLTATTSTTDKDGLTLADLQGFLQDADQAGVDPRSRLHVRVGLRGQPKTITTTAPVVETGGQGR